MTYIFDTGSELGHAHMDYLAELLDDHTVKCLVATGLRPGWRCLELGAGGGSIARWLSERVSPSGRVVAVDVDTDQLAAHPRIEVLRRDVNDGVPDGPFDLIHARLLLMHLPRRAEILSALVDALAPGGWLVLGEFTGRPLTALSTPGDGDLALWERMQHLSHAVVSPKRGISFAWAHQVPDALTEAGLVDVDAEEYSRTVAGGDAGCLLHRNLNEQAEPLLRQAGASDDDLARYRELMLDPRFRAWFYQFVCTRGRRPA